MLELTQKERKTQIPQYVRHFLSSDSQFSKQNGMTKVTNPTAASLCHYLILELETFMKAHTTYWRCTLHFGFPVTHLLKETSNTYKVVLKSYLLKGMYWSLAPHSDNRVTILVPLILPNFCSHYREKQLLSRKKHKNFVKWLGLCVGNLQSHRKAITRKSRTRMQENAQLNVKPSESTVW